MAARVTSVFLYVKDVRRSLEFYNEVVGAEIVQVHAEEEGAPYSLAILRIGYFTLMLHPQEPHADEFTDTRVGRRHSSADPGSRRGCVLSALHGRRCDPGHFGRTDRSELGLARVRAARSRRLCLVDLPGQVGRSVDGLRRMSSS